MTEEAGVYLAAHTADQLLNTTHKSHDDHENPAATESFIHPKFDND